MPRSFTLAAMNYKSMEILEEIFQKKVAEILDIKCFLFCFIFLFYFTAIKMLAQVICFR